MKIQKEQKLDMHIQKIIYYSRYVDCLSRIITDIAENEFYNLKPSDLPKMLVLLNSYTSRLYMCVMNMKSDWEFK